MTLSLIPSPVRIGPHILPALRREAKILPRMEVIHHAVPPPRKPPPRGIDVYRRVPVHIKPPRRQIGLNPRQPRAIPVRPARAVRQLAMQRPVVSGGDNEDVWA